VTAFLPGSNLRIRLCFIGIASEKNLALCEMEAVYRESRPSIVDPAVNEKLQAEVTAGGVHPRPILKTARTVGKPKRHKGTAIGGVRVECLPRSDEHSPWQGRGIRATCFPLRGDKRVVRNVEIQKKHRKV